MLVPNVSYYPQNVSPPPNLNQQQIGTVTPNMIGTPVTTVKPSPELMQAYYAPSMLQAPVPTAVQTQPMVPPVKPAPKSIWATASPEKLQRIQQMGEHYKAFLANSKTDLSTVNEIIKRAKEEGFQHWPANQPERAFMPGEKFYRVNRDRTVQLIVIGKEPLSSGFKMVASHIDSPHISLKARPLQDSAGGFATFKTLVHGGLKPHQWTQRNLALVGKIVKQDGTTVNVDIGNKPGEPVFIIPELAPHVDTDRDKKVPLESLTPIVASQEAYSLGTNTESTLSDQVEKILFQHYGITKEDLENAQLDLVPATVPRDVGFDRSMISGYGQDDKTSAYAAMEALISNLKYNPVPNKTLIAGCYGNEEIASWNSYGAKSDDTRMMLAEIMKYTTGTFDEFALKQGFKNSLIVSADVSTAIDPVNPGAEDATNAAVLGYGPAIAKEGKLTATPEASAYFKSMLQGIQTQTHTFNQDKGGGGTLGNYIATQNNADVVDIGVPVIGMHSPNEVTSKADIYELTTALMSYFNR